MSDDFPTARQVSGGMIRYGLAILVALAVLGGAIGIWRTVTAPANMVGGIVQQTFNAQHALESYRWFHTSYQAVNAKTGQIRLSKAALEAAATDRKEARRVELLGAQQSCQSLVSDYNARATRADTVIFMHPEKFLPGNWPGEQTRLPSSLPLSVCD